MAHRMIWNQTAYFGPGSIAEIPRELVARGFTKALVVTDQVLVDTGVTARVTTLLDEAGFAYEVFSDVAPNPPIECVQAGVAAFATAGADVLIAVGGGSPQDTCKAVGIVTANPEFADVRSLEGVAATRNRSVPIIAVPTTAGTASETTINYVITDVERQRKFVCVDPNDIPLLAVVDPEMMATAPRALKVATGLDALTHAIEGYITAGAWELSDLFHLKAIQVIAAALPGAADGDDEAMERMAMAQYIAGMGYSNVGLGLVHAMAHPLGAFFDAPHGVANGILLAPVMAFNASSSAEKYRDIAAAFGVDTTGMGIEDARQAAVVAVAALTESLGNPTTITEIGASEADIPALAQAAYDDVCAGGNPRTATVEQIADLYRSLL
ncbi:lactaldehyde reductase [Xylanimonas allomyrinae]|uniref:Lactaldehyde reductase n=1 Tax=Xylanimonas allomyrinae TaxID=2509459 RepID=A0A4P6EP96_9MICO|nr:lactaldehyde reductase [Xylanimonas allomyrinae]QAY64572.1 lactaldehyde reductase [Xylanimonas allomyrinae]